MAQQQGNGDLGGTFSKLNINAMEFVPSFRPRSAAPAAVETVEGGAPIVDVATPAPATVNDTTSAEFIIIIPNRTMSSLASSGATTPNTDTASETGTIGSISAGASPVHTRAVVGAEAAGIGSTQDVSVEAEVAAAATDVDAPHAVTHDVVAAASSEDSFVDADAAQSTEALADKSPENPGTFGTCCIELAPWEGSHTSAARFVGTFRVAVVSTMYVVRVCVGLHVYEYVRRHCGHRSHTECAHVHVVYAAYSHICIHPCGGLKWVDTQETRGKVEFARENGYTHTHTHTYFEWPYKCYVDELLLQFCGSCDHRDLKLTEWFLVIHVCVLLCGSPALGIRL